MNKNDIDHALLDQGFYKDIDNEADMADFGNILVHGTGSCSKVYVLWHHEDAKVSLDKVIQVIEFVVKGNNL